MQYYDTIIVGLGAAGCSAASTLCRAGKRVLAVEAQDRIGGRVQTVPFGNGVVELGAEWIHGTVGSRVYDLAIQNNITLVPHNLEGFDIFRSDGTTANNTIVNDLIDFTFITWEEPPEKPGPLGQHLTNKLMNYIQTKYPQLLSNKDFINEFLQFMDLVIDNYDSSNSWNDISTHAKYQQLEGHQHISWHRYGYKTLFEILLNTYNNGPGFPNLDIKLQKEVTQILWTNDPQQDVVVKCNDDTSYAARNIIVTVSLGVLKAKHATLFSPSLPKDKVTAIENMTIGVMDKIELSFDKPWWPQNYPFLGFVWNSKDKAKISKEDQWTTKIFGASSPMGSPNSLTLWTSGETAKLVETLPEDVVKAKVMELLRKFLGRNRSIPEPRSILRSTWSTNPFTRGSYSYDSVLAPLHPDTRVILARPLLDSSGAPRVLFAGEATHNNNYSTVHGATDTGHREAMRLLPKAKL